MYNICGSEGYQKVWKRKNTALGTKNLLRNTVVVAQL
jgi:hypothetical protein